MNILIGVGSMTRRTGGHRFLGKINQYIYQNLESIQLDFN